MSGLGTGLVLAIFAWGAAEAAEAPALPEGSEEASTAAAPALPEGLAEAPTAEAPALPEGLAEAPAAEAPALPEGLGGDAPDGPAVPEGLGEAPAAPDAPALPEGLGEEPDAAPADASEETPSRKLRPAWLHGFWDVRGGVRTQNDPAQSKDATLGELRLQLEADKAWDGLVLKYRGDFIGDGVLEEGDFDLRELSLTFSPASFVDVRVGRQVLTWGTGDLLFVNDLFPKDWQAFLSGRDVEYLKAPSDAIRTTWFTDWVNIDFVYTPQFDHDRFITGERMSFYNSLYGRTVGADREVNFNAPSTWFEDDEYALRLYRMVGSAELAFYAYSGYWKSPGGQRFPPMQATFPKLSVYGASLRGNFLNGIGNVELAYYDSRQDRGGDNPFVNNSEFRLLLGYERELAKELTGSVQYYLEHMMDYGAYRNSLIPLIMDARDQDRHLFTVRLTKLLMRQDLTLSLFAFFSPSDVDTYLRPQVSYKVNDQWTVECGGNVFFGEKPSTFFGQFEDNTNVYGAVRYSF
ncbi:MAG TPA: hypothetical protein PKX85_17075 [Candidatus Hydrogenedentes bacterium]|nr:hypothetical protein [Candidatus Hydrogenedentota bacterium]